jgi:hypothetical protein
MGPNRIAPHILFIFHAPQVVEALMRRGADPDRRNREGYSPVDVAQAYGYGDLVMVMKPPVGSRTAEVARLDSTGGEDEDERTGLAGTAGVDEKELDARLEGTMVSDKNSRLEATEDSYKDSFRGSDEGRGDVDDDGGEEGVEGPPEDSYYYDF